MKTRSLKFRITWPVASLFTITWLVLVAGIFFLVETAIIIVSEEELLVDSELIASTYLLNAPDQTLDTLTGQAPTLISANLGVEDSRHYQIWNHGVLVARSAGAIVLEPPFEPGISERDVTAQEDGETVHIRLLVASYYVSGAEVWAVATQDLSEVEAPGFFPTIPAFVTLVFILPLVILALTWTIGRALDPVASLAARVAAREATDATRIDTLSAPTEIAPIISALNQLIGKHESAILDLDRVLEHEKRFTMNAAHELLTPLAAIRSEVQLQIREASSEVREQRALQRISTRVDRAVHTVEQLLTLARLEPQSARSDFEDANLTARIQFVAASFANEIEAKEVIFSMNESEVHINGLPMAIDILCRNILDNAVRYTPRGGRIDLEVGSDSSGCLLTLRNETENPLPSYLGFNVFDRFVRGPQEVERGAGLGLSIVKRIAEIHNATVSLTNVENGVELNVLFPSSRIG